MLVLMEGNSHLNEGFIRDSLLAMEAVILVVTGILSGGGCLSKVWWKIPC